MPQATATRTGASYNAASSRKLDQLQDELSRLLTRIYDTTSTIRTHLDSILGSVPEASNIGSLKQADQPTGRAEQNLQAVSELHMAVDSLQYQVERLAIV